jgi:hypothetical protein
MGDVEVSEIYEYPGKKLIVKIKVAINVHKPIPSGIHVGNPTDGTCWVDFRYEKLPQMCFKCGLVGHAEKLCRNQALNMDTLAPLGPWIRSTQYGRRKMDEKDRKFYSNPSHSPNFGHYSPTVPTSLLEQLAALKLQAQQQANGTATTSPEQTRQEKNTQNQTQEPSQGKKSIGDASPGKLDMERLKQAKRLKTAGESTPQHLENMDVQLMAGLVFQASQQP